MQKAFTTGPDGKKIQVFWIAVPNRTWMDLFFAR